MGRMEGRELFFIFHVMLTTSSFLILLISSRKVSCLAAFETPLETLPKFVSQEKTYKVVQDGSVIISCQVDDIGPYALIWKKGYIVLTAGDFKISLDPRLHLVNGFDLKIENVQPEDEGEYICQLSTSPPAEQKNALVTLVPPQVRIWPTGSKVSVVKGDSVNLKCEGGGKPQPSIKWSRKHNRMMPNGEMSIEVDSLVIQKVERWHSGGYICTGSNAVGVPAQVEIEVLVKFPPEIEVERHSIHGGFGKEVSLICIVHANPPITKVKWYKETLLLENDSRHLYDPTIGSRHSITIKNLQVSDFGNYSCEATNELGKSRQYIELSGRPTRPSFDRGTYDPRTGGFNISWHVESYFPVDEYRLSYRRKIHDEHHYHGSGQWHQVVLPAENLANTWSTWFSAKEVTKNRVHSKYYLIKDLDVGLKYEAKVEAKNKYGWGESSKLHDFKPQLPAISPEAAPQQDIGIIPTYLSSDCQLCSVSLPRVFCATTIILVIRNYMFYYFEIFT